MTGIMVLLNTILMLIIIFVIGDKKDIGILCAAHLISVTMAMIWG